MGEKNMSKRELLINEIEQVPDPLLEEVIDFFHFLQAKKQREDIAIASQFSLGRDWLKPEEDKAWHNL